MLTASMIGMLAILAVSALFSLLIHRVHSLRSFQIGMWGCVAACVVGLGGSVFALLSGEQIADRKIGSLPLGEIVVGLDGLSASFLLCVCVVCGLASLYALDYFKSEAGKGRSGVATFLFNVLVISMMGVVMAHDAISFLVSWEIMTISSFFLVAYEHERSEVRKASLIYLIASHIGVIAIFVLFALLARHTGNYRFDGFLSSPLSDASLTTACFFLALVGFGTKAGIWLLHIWLPEAHPAAPSHVSAVMSGVMIKMGIYGLLRTLTFLGTPPPEWGLLLIGVGIVSGISGVLHALGQHDLKRLLAYHSIENIGIIALGIGVGLLGQSYDKPVIVFLGYAGALLHVLNHALFKGLLFQGAGHILHQTGARNLEAMGGLLPKMPVTGGTFLIGSAAISGLPPLNGFVSEWLIYMASFYAIFEFRSVASGVCVASIVSLALIGGLAAACFAKAFGVAFLGQPRSKIHGPIQKSEGAMKVAMILGAAACVGIGLFPQWAILIVARPIGVLSATAVFPEEVGDSLQLISRTALLLLCFLGALFFLRHKLLQHQEIRWGTTWGCGYSFPTARMQYTAGSFAQPLLRSFGAVLLSRKRNQPPQGYFPSSALFGEHLVDRSLENVWTPIATKIILMFRRLKVLQQGQLQSYLLYILITLILILFWKIR